MGSASRGRAERPGNDKAREAPISRKATPIPNSFILRRPQEGEKNFIQCMRNGQGWVFGHQEKQQLIHNHFSSNYMDGWEIAKQIY